MDWHRLEKEVSDLGEGTLIESKSSTVTIVQPFLTLLALVVVPCLCVLAVAGTWKVLTIWF